MGLPRRATRERAAIESGARRGDGEINGHFFTASSGLAMIVFLLALAVVIVPLGLAGLLIEWRARKLLPFENSRIAAAAGLATALSSIPDRTATGK